MFFTIDFTRSASSRAENKSIGEKMEERKLFWHFLDLQDFVCHLRESPQAQRAMRTWVGIGQKYNKGLMYFVSFPH